MVVHIIHGSNLRPNGLGQGSPYITLMAVERHVHGNGISIHVWGDIKIAAKEVVWARDLKLNTLEWMVLTPHTGDHHPWHAQKYINNPGALNNYASIDIFGFDYAYEMLAGDNGRQSQISCPTTLPEDGSLTIEFEAKGE